MEKIRCMHCMRTYNASEPECPNCGFVPYTPPESPVHLYPGTALASRYLVGTVIGFSGFSITYVGWDNVLEQRVAIKEYFPDEISTRSPESTSVLLFDLSYAEPYLNGRAKFLEEAKNLARFQSLHGIVRIFDFFEANDTAYIIMEFLEGVTLEGALHNSGCVSIDIAINVLAPIMSSLELVHERGLIHGDISPDNIFLSKDNVSKLIDFGFSRYAAIPHGRGFTALATPGYSPEEQYRGGDDQGPYTDVYALAATLYRMITGITPIDAVQRYNLIEKKRKDPLKPPSQYVKNISKNQENAILNALNVSIEDRTPTVEKFLEDLTGEKPVERIYGRVRKPFKFKPLLIALLIIVILATLALFYFLAADIIDFNFGPIIDPAPPSSGDMSFVPEVEELILPRGGKIS